MFGLSSWLKNIIRSLISWSYEKTLLGHATPRLETTTFLYHINFCLKEQAAAEPFRPAQTATIPRGKEAFQRPDLYITRLWVQHKGWQKVVKDISRLAIGALQPFVNESKPIEPIVGRFHWQAQISSVHGATGRMLSMLRFWPIHRDCPGAARRMVGIYGEVKKSIFRWLMAYDTYGWFGGRRGIICVVK